jgi:SAM-dependent methyltransferase
MTKKRKKIDKIFVRDYWNKSAGGYKKERWEKNNIVKFDYYWTKQTLFDYLRPEKDDVVLEIGCGPGTWTKLVLGSVKKLVAVDISSKMIKQARKNAPGAEFHICDAMDINLKQKFDKIFSVRMIEYVYKKEKFLRLLYSMLKPGGRLVIITKSRPCLWDITSRSEWQRKVNSSVMKKMLKSAGFCNVKYEPVSIRLPIFRRGVYEARIVSERYENAFLGIFDGITKIYKKLKIFPLVSSVFSESYVISAEKRNI